MDSAASNFNNYDLKGKISKSVYIQSKDFLEQCLGEEHDVVTWKNLWKKAILQVFNDAYSSLEELEGDLQEKDLKLVLLIDGLEDIFDSTTSVDNQKLAIRALCRDLMGEIQATCSCFGLMIFLRKDMARDSIPVNFEQFYSSYRSTELHWSNTEALRLAVWLTEQAIPGFYYEATETEMPPIELAPRDVIEHVLQKLWGIKLGKLTSNEANSSRWILAALSDFNGQLQARDIIRFLEKATENSGNPIYTDRYLMPAEIKWAVAQCSNEKINDIRKELKNLAQVFEKLEQTPDEKKILPFKSEDINLTQEEERIMIQEGYLRIEDGKYYLPEIIRHALQFKYEKGARPKVLSLLKKA